MMITIEVVTIEINNDNNNYDINITDQSNMKIIVMIGLY